MFYARQSPICAFALAKDVDPRAAGVFSTHHDRVGKKPYVGRTDANLASCGTIPKEGFAVKPIWKLLNSPFEGFDWSVLDRDDFLEDSVREEIIAPLLRTLTYRAASPNRIIRSPRLQHPFVAIGATKHNISLVPDYLLHVDDRPAWILEAKSPRELVLDPMHEAQAYSYVIHREVRAEWYAVCNGREFAAFHVADMAGVPRLHFRMDDLDANWSELFGSLAPEHLTKTPGGYSKDFGIHLVKLGCTRDTVFEFSNVPLILIGRVGPHLFTTNAVLSS